LYHRLRALGLDEYVPAARLQRLHDAHYLLLQRNLRWYRGLAAVLEALRGVQVPVIVLKGAYLAEAVYSNPGLRSVGDVDLLVRERDLDSAAEGLRELGYRAEDSRWTGKHLPILSRAGAPSVDLHWTIETPYCAARIDLEGIWERARSAKIAGVDVLTLCPDDLLLHLCLHVAFEHRFLIDLAHLCDIVEVVDRFQNVLDWREVEGRSREWRIHKGVFLVLDLAVRWLGAQVPEAVLESLRPSDLDDEVTALVQARLTGEAEAAPLESVALARAWTAAARRDRWRILRAALLPPRRSLARIYAIEPDSSRIWAHYLVRWKDLLFRQGPHLWRLLRADSGARSSAERDAALWRWLET
jgi:hypothetical protein